jgi:hypothetical protein
LSFFDGWSWKSRYLRTSTRRARWGGVWKPEWGQTPFDTVVSDAHSRSAHITAGRQKLPDLLAEPAWVEVVRKIVWCAIGFGIGFPPL